MRKHDQPSKQLEVELRELRRLARYRQLLELPATIFTEMCPDHCVGECDNPVVISNVGMTCCHFYLGFVRYNEVLKLERLQRQAIEFGRRPLGKTSGKAAIEGAGLQLKFPRDFTGSYRLRKLELPPGMEDPTEPKPPIGKPEKDH